MHPSFVPLLSYLRSPLVPLVSATTGLPHPDFPSTIFAYHLLTAQQLDDLAWHFHQVWPPLEATTAYPNPIPPWLGTGNEKTTDIQAKRRLFGRFIGLKRCDSPI